MFPGDFRNTRGTGGKFLELACIFYIIFSFVSDTLKMTIVEMHLYPVTFYFEYNK